MSSKSDHSLDLGARLALRPKEAATVLGVSERWLREHLPELPHVRRDGCVLLPVDGLRKWLDREAEVESKRSEELVLDIARELNE